MAGVDVYCTRGHITALRERPRAWGDELVPMCSCGWVGPAYPTVDEGSAVQACHIHVANDDDGTVVFGVRFTSPPPRGFRPGPSAIAGLRRVLPAAT